MQSQEERTPLDEAPSPPDLLDTLLSITSRVDGFLYRCRNDRDYSMLHISEGIELVSGYSSSDFLNNRKRAFSSIIHEGDLKAVYDAVDLAISQRTSWRIDYRIVHRSGACTWVHEVGAGVHGASGELLYLEGFVIDIARRKAMETELFDTHVQLRQSLAEREAALALTEAANQAKANFLAIMNHELRTPLNAIIGFSDLIRSQAFGPIENVRYLGYVTEINESGKHLLEIINNMLELTQLTSGTRAVQIEPVTLAQLSPHAMEGLESIVASKQLTVEFAPEVQPLQFAADRRSLVRVLHNVIDNAAKFTASAGHIRVHAELGAGESTIAIVVDDDGIGIPADQLQEIARPFTLVRSSYNRAVGGLGLGLAISKALVTTMAGELQISSDVGKGTSVRILLPAWSDRS